MDDLISRQAAIDAMHHYSHFDDFDQSVIDEETAVIAIKELPPAQPEQDAFTKWAKSVADRYRPERKKGKWLMSPDGWAYCSICESFPEGMMGLTNYCPNCGSYNGGENEV